MHAALQVREKEDRHQQQKISGFLQPVEDIQAARAAAAAADMEVGHHYLSTPLSKACSWASNQPKLGAAHSLLGEDLAGLSSFPSLT